MKFSIAYIVTLIDDLVSQDIPEIRIVLGGFSQGCAMTLLTGLISRYARKLAGLVGYPGTSLSRIEYPSREEGLGCRRASKTMWIISS
jgi:lysophospholipase-1